MFGNWDTGSRDIATNPMSTMRMEITIATMGRLMKNLAITCNWGLWLRVSLLRHTVGRSSIRNRIHHRAFPDFLYTFSHHAITGFHVSMDNPVLADLFAGDHRPDADLVIRVDHGDERAPLQIGHSPLRNQQRIRLHTQLCAHPDEHARGEQSLRIGK